MKPVLLVLLGLGLFAACNNEKKENSPDNKAKSDTSAASGSSVPVTPVAINSPAAAPTLSGTWELNYISGPKITFEGLYPNKKPAITFDVANKTVSGNTGCNNFSGTLKTEENKIDFNQSMAITKMMCPGQGETVFLETLKKISSYSITDSTLTFIMGDIALMRFSKK